MALRLVRQISDTPNITNKDDVVSTRYSYGGYNGVVKGFGSECGYTAESGVFKDLDGRIVIDGWEIDVDGAGWSLDLSQISGTQYCSIYMQISVVTENIMMYTTYLTGHYPEVDKGDDLTAIPNGTARLLLYNVKVENGTITEVVKKVEVIRHIKERIDELGFKRGVVRFYSVDENGIETEVFSNNELSSINSLTKQGKYALFSLYIDWLNFPDSKTLRVKIPDDFLPLNPTVLFYASKTIITETTLYEGNMYKGSFDLDMSSLPTYHIQNLGWQIK